MIYDEDLEFEEEEEEEEYTAEDEVRMLKELKEGMDDERIYFWYCKRFNAYAEFEVCSFSYSGEFALHIGDKIFLSQEAQDVKEVVGLMEESLKQGEDVVVEKLGLDEWKPMAGAIY